MSERDRIDLILEQWARERPDLDVGGFGIVGRVLVLGRVLERRITAVLADVDLSLWEFDVLATLRRQGAPYRLTPTELSRATMLTPGAMTNRLDRLEERGLVRREADPEDRRGLHVVLEKRGLTLVDRAVALRFQEARQAVAALPAKDRRTLETLLRTLSIGLDGPR